MAETMHKSNQGVEHSQQWPRVQLLAVFVALLFAGYPAFLCGRRLMHEIDVDGSGAVNYTESCSWNLRAAQLGPKRHV